MLRHVIVYLSGAPYCKSLLSRSSILLPSHSTVGTATSASTTSFTPKRMKHNCYKLGYFVVMCKFHCEVSLAAENRTST